MFRSSAAKRTGIYRVCGNIYDFQMQLRLRHISEWLPVPKFEYSGSNATEHHGDHYPESSLSSSFRDFFIYVPHDDHNGNYCNYYDYYNPSKSYKSRSSSSGGSSALLGSTGHTTTLTTAATGGSTESRSVPSSQLATHFEVTVDDFQTLNRELCSGATAQLCIGWQQKHFSRDELERYSDASKCTTTLQRRYHRWSKQTIELQLSYNEQLKYQQQAQAEQRRRRRSKHHSEAEAEGEEEGVLPNDPNFAARSCLIHTLIDADLSQQQQQQQPDQQSTQRFQLMEIYAQLQRDTLLFSLRYSPSEGLLYVYPDFNLCADDMEYSLEIDNDCRQLYAYGLQNVTSPSTSLERCSPLRPPRKLIEEEAPTALPAADATATQLLTHYQQQRELAAERRRLLHFTLPPKRMRRVALLLQLHEAQHFEHDNIHIRYYINPPQQTLLEPTEQMDEQFALRGATATCCNAGATRVANFSHCWQLTLLCEEAFDASSEQLLHIYFEVISIDSWQRERCEGYAHFCCSLLAPLPATVVSGLQLQCTRPLGSWLDALNRRFIGGRKLFDFVSYFGAQGKSKSTTLHSRWELSKACAMRSTGNILFSMRKLQQRQVSLGCELNADDDSNDDDDDAAAGHSGRHKGASSTLDEVLAAYVEARDRIEALLGDAAAL